MTRRFDREEAELAIEQGQNSLAASKLETAVALELFKERAAKKCEKRAEGRFFDYGTTEYDTGATYYEGRRSDEYETRDEEDESCATDIRALPTTNLSDEARRIIEDAALGKRLRAFVKGCDNAPGTPEEMMSSGFDEWSEAEWHVLQDAARKEKNDG